MARRKKNAGSKGRAARSTNGQLRRTGTRRRYTQEERQRILETAQREGLTGAQVRDRFGVSTLSFYLWRKKSGSPANGRFGTPATSATRLLGADDDLAGTIRDHVRAQIREILPEIVRSEVAAAFSSSNRGRRRSV